MRHSSSAKTLCTLHVAVMLVTFAVPGTAQKKTQPVFRQDLESFGYKFKRSHDWDVKFTNVIFLSEDLLLVSVKEITPEELHYKNPTPGVAVYDNPFSGPASPTSLSKLFLFSVGEGKLLRSADLPIRKARGAIQPGPNGTFFMLSAGGLQLCSSTFQCSPPKPTSWPLRVSPLGNKIVTGGFRSEQQVLDGNTLSVLDTFKGASLTAKPPAPIVIPGDSGLMLASVSGVSVLTPGGKTVDMGFAGDAAEPPVSRFLDNDKVVGITEVDNSFKGKVTVARVDGTVLHQIDMKANRLRVHLVTASSGLRFAVKEEYYTRFNSFWNLYLDDNRDQDRLQIRVFDVASGKQVFDIGWDPRHYHGFEILPALSPSGNRIAIVRNGQLEVYDIP